MRKALVALLCCLIAFSYVYAIGKGHLYSKGDPVAVHVSKVGPYLNPTEQYDYYSLPLCAPKGGAKAIRQNLGEKLEGDRTKTTPFLIDYRTDVVDAHVCPKKHLTAQDVAKLKHAVSHYYYFEFEIDKIPVRGFLGKVQDSKSSPNQKTVYLFTHMEFTLLYNDHDQDAKGKGVVIYANVSTNYDKRVALKDGPLDVQFTYSAKWHKTEFRFKDRKQYWTSPSNSQELEIHWLSILNSFVLVVLLTSFLAIIILRILKNDYARYDDKDPEDGEDYGWKQVSSDVFRYPPLLSLFCAFQGVGVQFLLIMSGILILAVVGLYYPGNEGNLVVSAVVLYALTCATSGFCSVRWYVQMNGKSWQWNIILATTIYAMPFFLNAFVLNMVAVSWQSTASIPVTAVLTIIAIWLFVGFPLTLFGGFAGRRMAGTFYAPVRTKNFRREIPPIPWFRSLPLQMLMAGFLPFSAIYIELFYVFNSVWGRSTYQLWGILCLVFIILLIVTACITVALTYFQLSMEDWRWWWHSFLSGGSTGLFIYAYAIFYYAYRSRMTGFLQASYYFGYMALICYFFFCMLGFVGWYSSLIFVRNIFKNLHFD